MPIPVEIGSTGRVVEFPDGTLPEDIEAALQNYMAQAATPVDAAPMLPEGDIVDAFADPLRTIGTGAVSNVAGGLSGLAVGVGEMLGIADPGAGARTVEAFQQQTSMPKTQIGQEALETVGGGVQWIMDKFNIPISGVGGVIELVSGQGLEQAVETIRRVQEEGAGVVAGDRVLEETGSPLAATFARIAPEAAVEIATLKGAQKLFKYESPAKQKIVKMIEEGSTDVETAAVKLGTSIRTGGPKIVSDATAKEAIKQGFDPGVIAPVKIASEIDKAKMQRMVHLMERGKKNKLFALENRPSDVVGDSLLERFRVVRSTNRTAGKELDGVANSLRGRGVEGIDAIADDFIRALDSELGVRIKMRDGAIRPDFTGSIIEDLAAPEAAIKRIVARMSKGKDLDAFDLHRMKKFIDENVTYGTAGEGLKGKTEIVLKNLRRSIDDTLDSQFSKYDRVNSTYSETIDALDSLQDVAGKKMNLAGKNADKATGTLLRRLMSNAQSRVTLLDSIKKMDDVAKKFNKTGRALDDNIMLQALFADELDNVFGPVARTSLQGQIGQALDTAVEASTTAGMGNVALKAAGKAGDKLRGLNQEGAFNSIKVLLRE